MQQVIDFLLEMDRLKAVTRKVKPLGLNRYENSAEHSWHLCMFAIAAEPYAESPVDLNHVLRMLLVHDIGEIDTGDTMAYVEGGWEERKQEELAAVKRITSLLPAEQATALVALWEEFEQGETPEARFANAVDRAMPAILNLHNHGQSWKENDISYERVIKRLQKQIEDGSPKLWAYMKQQLDLAREKNYFGA